MTDTLDSLRLERDAWRRSCEEARAQLANNDQLIAEQVAQIRELERERDEARIMMERQAEEVCSEIEAATAHVERAEARAEKAERERDDLERDLKKERHDTDFLIENLKAAGITIEPAQGGIYIRNAAESLLRQAERERDEAREEVERLTAVTPHTGKEIADLALKWAVAGWMSHSPEMITAERSKFEHHVLTTFCACARPYKDRAEAAEARLARMRAEALEEAARVAEQEVTTYHEGMSAVDVRLSHTRGPKWPDGPSIANAIRALASDTGTGGEQP
jgi:hypothetical protein